MSYAFYTKASDGFATAFSNQLAAAHIITVRDAGPGLFNREVYTVVLTALISQDRAASASP
jgi:hypothetical protein